MAKECGCGKAPILIFPCSGAADVGEITDKAARELSREDVGDMACLAGIGGGISGMIESAKAASKILVIDGCPQDCAKKTFFKAGIKEIKFVRVTDLGFLKGKSPANPERVVTVMNKAKEMLAC